MSLDFLQDAPAIFHAEDPIDLVRSWMKEAVKKEPNDPEAIALATVDGQGLPDVRMVLLREIEDNGFIFYTNYESAKGQQLSTHSGAAFVLHWKSLRRQIRVRGWTHQVESEKSDAYFTNRPLQNRYAAHASAQSRPLESRTALIARAAACMARYPLGPARPNYWGGIRIVPVQIEFWADGQFRLHDRFCWNRQDPMSSWSVVRLNP